MARRIGGTCSRPPHVMRPREGVERPMAVRSSVVFPEPFGPINTVGVPELNVSVIRSRIVTAPAATVTLSNVIGRSTAGARMFIPKSLAGAPSGPGKRVDRELAQPNLSRE